ncbi:MAG: endonuclease/exonuclease/phosphatase family protein [Rhodothermales bacterium]
MKLIFSICALGVIAATLLPIWKHEAWWIRIFDFPRQQIAAGGLAIAAGYALMIPLATRLDVAILIVLAVCSGYQCWKIVPYTPLHPPQVKTARTEARSCGRVSVLIANVLMENRESDRFIDLVREHDPDVLLTVETDRWWVDVLSSLDGSYPYSVKVPLPSTYGMTLQSRLEVVESEVRYLVDDGIPSIYARIMLPEGTAVRIYGLHPRPPGPTQDADTIDRDAEVLVVGREVRASDEPTIVMGDLNDVAWSYSTNLFQRISGMLDPRIGRGTYSTFHAGNVLMRWPLDHLFHSGHFKLVRIERLPAWGSDHFPMFVRLQYSANGEEVHDVPEAGRAARSEAIEKIDKAYDD